MKTVQVSLQGRLKEGQQRQRWVRLTTGGRPAVVERSGRELGLNIIYYPSLLVEDVQASFMKSSIARCLCMLHADSDECI